MAETAIDSNRTRIYKKIYAILIASFATFSFFVQVIAYHIEVGITQKLYWDFESTYPDQSKAFKWAFASSSNYCILALVVAGLAMFILFVFWIHFFYKVEMGEYRKLERIKGKVAIIADLAIVLTYLAIFWLYSALSDSTALQRPINLVWVSAFALVWGVSCHMLLLHDHLREQRIKEVPSKNNLKNHQWDFLKQSYEIELSEYREAITNLIWIGGSLGAGLVFSSVLQYIFALPIAISFSNDFGMIIGIYVFKMLIVILVLVVGVIRQLLIEVHDIVALIRRNAGLKT